MAIKLILMGKTEDSYLKKGIELYIGRIGHYCKFSIIEIGELKQVSSLSREQIKEKEGLLILNQIKPSDHLILLDERGNSCSSVEWAQHLEHLMAHSSKDIAFAVGGS